MFFEDFDMDYEFLVHLHDMIVDSSGGLKGVRSEGLIRSALGRPNQSAFGKDMHTTDVAKAAALLHSIAINHGFRDGNKRTAMAAAVIFLKLKGKDVLFTNQEYEDFMLHVVNTKPGINDIAQWFTDHLD